MAADDSLAAPSPAKLAHIVLRTSSVNYANMVDFYTAYVGGIVSAHDEISFIRYDDEHHRIGICRLDNIEESNASSKAPGLDHVAFTFASLRDLATAYRFRKSRGILPIWCTNHGPGTSLYYRDPDGNLVESQVDNFDDMDDAIKFIHGSDFKENPIGVDFDPEELFAKLDAGMDEKLLKKRGYIGPRKQLPDIFIK